MAIQSSARVTICPSLPELSGSRGACHDHPDFDCCLCCLWLCLAEFSWTQDVFRHGGSSVSRAVTDCIGSYRTGLYQAKLKWDLPGNLASSHRFWPATGNLPAVQLYQPLLPRDILESAFIDGASNFTIFTRLILPLSVPALASFAIFQFLWVWNDYLVALVFLGGKTQVMTMALANMVGEKGQDWQLLTSGAFISMLLPLAVFFALQRYFVRGLMAGSVKG